METANTLREKLRTSEHRRASEKQQRELDGSGETALLKNAADPPPTARVRVYACQSTHKTPTALRQGSMIHVNDQDFKDEVEWALHEAYMTHTSSSPTYHHRFARCRPPQVELEGFQCVQRQIEAPMSMRKAIATHPLLSRYFKMLTAGDMIPADNSQSGINSYYEPEQGWSDVWEAWSQDELVLDPSARGARGRGTRWDGGTFKGSEVVSSSFIIADPPGFPILVPGQVISHDPDMIDSWSQMGHQAHRRYARHPDPGAGDRQRPHARRPACRLRLL